MTTPTVPGAEEGVNFNVPEVIEQLTEPCAGATLALATTSETGSKNTNRAVVNTRIPAATSANALRAMPSPSASPYPTPLQLLLLFR